MDTDYRAQTVRLQVQAPIGYERAQLLVRLLVGCTFFAVHQSLGGLFGLLYLLLPVTAAILISQHTATRYLEQDGPWLISVLEWFVGLYAYMLFVTDRFPLGPSERPVRLVATPSGSPSVRRALGRLITSLPHALLLLVFSLLSGLATLIMAVSVLIAESVPDSLRSFQLGLLGWLTRVLVYHGSLCETYPGFGFGAAWLPSSTGSDGEAHDGSAA